MSRQLKKQQNDEAVAAAATKAGHLRSLERIKTSLLESGLSQSGQVKVYDNGQYFRVQSYHGFVDLAKSSQCFTAIINCTISQDTTPFDNPTTPPPIYVTLGINQKLNEETYRQLLDYVTTLKGFTFIAPKDAETIRNIKFSLTGHGLNFLIAYNKAITLTNLINEKVSDRFAPLPSFEEEMSQIQDAVRLSEVERKAAIAPENFPALPKLVGRKIDFSANGNTASASSGRPGSPYSNATRSVSPSAPPAVQKSTIVSDLIPTLDTPAIDEGQRKDNSIEGILEQGLKLISNDIARIKGEITESEATIRKNEGNLSAIIEINKPLRDSIALLTEGKIPNGEAIIATMKASIDEKEKPLVEENSAIKKVIDFKEKRIALYEKIKAEHESRISEIKALNVGEFEEPSVW